MKFSRYWAMPSPDTFRIRPISAMLDRLLHWSEVVIDPFARNSDRGTLRNDLNPETLAENHLPAQDFLRTLRPRCADAFLLDPPYSPRQISEVYQAIGRKCSTTETQNARLYREIRDMAAPLVKIGGIAISFGWNSVGFGKDRGFEKREIMLVCHGGAHNDTIVVVEEKIA